jgi:hypothetical protein
VSVCAFIVRDKCSADIIAAAVVVVEVVVVVVVVVAVAVAVAVVVVVSNFPSRVMSSPKFRHLSIRLHGVITQNTIT